MEPFYFGNSSKYLFGVYHPPSGSIKRNVGVILCYPMGQEYIRYHRAFYLLANSISSIGFNVLRFDYYGCGDSAGDGDQGSIGQWVADISTAIDELIGGCTISRICLVGNRLGATLSLIAGSKRDDVSGYVLWNPIVNGMDYFEELSQIHLNRIQGSFAKPLKTNSKTLDEILGFPVTEHMIEELTGIDRSIFEQKFGEYLFFVESNRKRINEQIIQRFKLHNPGLDYRYIFDNDKWLRKEDEMNKILIPVKVLNNIRSWIDNTFE